MSDKQHIIIAGTGPAGTTTALGLAKLGYAITVLSVPRPYSACEGVSERVVTGLANAGIKLALNGIAAPSERNVNWNGSTSTANTERLLRRDVFDQALHDELIAAGVTVIAGKLIKAVQLESSVSIEAKMDSGDSIHLHAVFFVEARGRSAPSGKQQRMRGPETVALLQHWQGEPCVAQSAAASFKDGWAWLAQFSDGSRYTQIIVAADAADFPKKSNLNDYFFQHLKQIPTAAPFYQNSEPKGKLIARSATAILSSDIISDRTIRIGDAALAVDPLSGNGIFQALSSALVAPVVINTLLQRPDHKTFTKQFYRERVHHAFMRFARMGRDFYQMESQWAEQPFWQQRQCWPDHKPTHERNKPNEVSIVSRPVVQGDFISLQEVVITPDQPLGVWHVEGIIVAPIVKNLQSKPLPKEEKLLSRLQDFGIEKPQQREILAAWIKSQRII